MTAIASQVTFFRGNPSECQDSRQSQFGHWLTGLLRILSSPNSSVSNSPKASSLCSIAFIGFDLAFLSIAQMPILIFGNDASTSWSASPGACASERIMFSAAVWCGDRNANAGASCQQSLPILGLVVTNSGLIPESRGKCLPTKEPMFCDFLPSVHASSWTRQACPVDCLVYSSLVSLICQLCDAW